MDKLHLLFVPFVAFQIKHFICDYPLQTEYMLGKFKPTFKEYFGPLLSHCMVHAWGTFFIVFFIIGHAEFAARMGLLDLALHFITDRIKASPKLLGRFKALNEFEWLAHKGRIDRAVQEEAIYDCWKAENEFNARKRSNKYFWWSLGADQLVHHLTNYLIVYLMFGYILIFSGVDI